MIKLPTPYNGHFAGKDFSNKYSILIQSIEGELNSQTGLLKTATLKLLYTIV